MTVHDDLPDWKLRPVKNDRGLWDALDGWGYGHVLGYMTSALVEAWIDGYDVGARENQ